MLDWLERDYGFDVVAASHLMGQTVGYDVGNVFNPAYTVVCRMPIDVVEQARRSRSRGEESRKTGVVSRKTSIRCVAGKTPYTGVSPQEWARKLGRPRE